MTAPVRVERAGLEAVQSLAEGYRHDAERSGRTLEPPLPAGALFWVARNGDEALGYAAGTLRPEGLLIGPVYVDEAHRRSGVGLALLRGVEAWAADARLPIMEVSVPADNDEGVSFLLAAGFEISRHLMTRRRTGPTGE